MVLPERNNREEEEEKEKVSLDTETFEAEESCQKFSQDFVKKWQHGSKLKSKPGSV